MRTALTLAFLLIALPLAADVDPDVAKVDKVFAQYAHRDTPGCAVGVARGGKVVLERAYGMASLEYDVPLTTSSVFEAGSVSKQFTAAMLVLLAEEGKLSLDDSIRKYLPELPEVNQPVTLRMMLNHTSGMRDWGTVTSLEGWRRGTRAHTMKHVLDIVKRQKSLNFTPGTRYSYSNTNYNLAALVAERVTGKPFPQLTRERVLGPAGMSHSSWRDDHMRIVKNRATAYDPVRGGGFETAMDYESIYGNCCLLTTVGDLLSWNENLRSPKIGKSLTESMQTHGRFLDGQTISYALGLIDGEYQGHREISHGGATAGWRAFLTRFPNDGDLSIAVLCNRGDAGPAGLARRVADVFLGTKQPDEAKVPPGDVLRYAGLYRDRDTDAVLRFFVKDGVLRSGLGEQGASLTPAGANRFTLGPDVVLEFDDSGLSLASSMHRTARYLRVPAQAQVKLGDYAGEYRSEEARAIWRVSVEEEKLMVQTSLTDSGELQPLDADGFILNGVLVRFTRDKRGRVDGLDVKADYSPLAAVARVERMHFDRVP